MQAHLGTNFSERSRCHGGVVRFQTLSVPISVISETLKLINKNLPSECPNIEPPVLDFSFMLPWSHKGPSSLVSTPLQLGVSSEFSIVVVVSCLALPGSEPSGTPLSHFMSAQWTHRTLLTQLGSRVGNGNESAKFGAPQSTQCRWISCFVSEK